MLGEIIGSIARTAGPAAAAYLAAHGIQLPGLSPDATVIAAVAVYAVAQGWSLVRKFKNKP